jgi:hypothetical protein
MHRIARSCVAAGSPPSRWWGQAEGGAMRRASPPARAEAAAGAASASATIANVGSLRITPVPRSLPVTNAA